jgi:DNA polymerase III sliding clamp (beta) subunit (PCNA family)
MLNKKTISVLEKFQNKVLPITESIHFVDGKIYTTDLTNFCIYKGQGKESDFALNIKDLKKVLSRTDIDDISLSSEGKASLTAGKKVFNFAAYTKDFVRIPQIDSEHIGVLEITKEIIGLKNFASKDDLRPNLKGLHWSSENSEIVATDAHILKRVETCIKPSKDLLIDSAVFNIPEGLYDVYESEKYVTFESNDFIFIIKETGEIFPNYRAIIPTEFTQKLEVGYKYFVECLNDALICANSYTSKGVIDGNVLKSEDLDMQSSFKCELMARETSSFAFGFNIKFMLSALKEIRNTDVVTIDLVSENRAMIINGNTLLMPLKLNK